MQTGLSPTPEKRRIPALGQVAYFKVPLLHATICDDPCLLDFSS